MRVRRDAFADAHTSSDDRHADTDLRRLARGGSLSLLGNVVSGIMGFVLVVVVTRALGVGGAGVFFEAVGLFSILAVAAELGVDVALVRMVSRYLAQGRVSDLRSVLAVSIGPVVGVALLSGVAVHLLAPQLSALLMRGHVEQGVVYLRILAWFIPLAAGTRAVLAATRGFGSVLPFVALESIFKPVVRPLAIMTVLALGYAGAAVMVSWAAPLAVELPLAFLILIGLLRNAERGDRGDPEVVRQSRFKAASEFWRFSAPRGIAVLFQVSVLWIDVLLVGALRSPEEAGVYAALGRLALVGTLVIEAVRVAIAPQFSELLTRKDHARAQRLFQVSTWWLMAPSWPIYILLMVFAPLLLGVFGPAFPQGETAFLIISGAYLMGLLTGNVTIVLLMSGHSGWNLANTGISLTINLVLNFALIPRYGINGAAIAWAVSVLFDNLAPLIQVRRLLGLHPFGPGHLRVALSSLALFGGLGIVIRSIFGLSVWTFLGTAVLASAVYAVYLWRSREALALPILWQALRVRVRPGPSARHDAPPTREDPPSPSRSVPRKLARSGVRMVGIATSAIRPEPEFIIIGAKRGGTTSMYRYLMQHPAALPLFPRMLATKGVRYFDHGFARGKAWYRSHFPSSLHRAIVRARRGVPPLTGEASPYYLFHPHAAGRAASELERTKLIVLLRDPVHRAYGHYRERVRHGAETLSFEEALEREAERLEGEVERMRMDEGVRSFAHEHFSYVTQGRYADSLEPWLARFPRERLLILLSEEFYADPIASYSRVLAFLGAPPFQPPVFTPFNYHPGPPMADATRRRLAASFRADNRRLAAMLDLDLSGWES